MKQKHKIVLSLLSCTFAFMTSSAFADCTSALTLPNTDQNYKGNDLGLYTIYLAPTITEIKNGDDYADYKRTWTGSCPGGLTGDDNSCIEFTVYPVTPTNFTKDSGTEYDIRQAISQYTGDPRDRGMVRILTNADESQYVYTTDHEHNYCGPYSMP